MKRMLAFTDLHYDKDTYVEVGLDKRYLAHGNVRRRIRRRGSICGTCVAKNGQVVGVTVIRIRR